MNTDQTTQATTTDPDSYGRVIEPSKWGPRGVIGRPEVSVSGNLILRVGTENGPGEGWSQSCHVVLTPEEGRQLIGAAVALLGLSAVDA